MLCTISKTIEFDAGHRVPFHASKCRSPHGHRYKVAAVCTGLIVEEHGASDDGMVMDFGELKAILMEKVHDALDHGFILCDQDTPMKALCNMIHQEELFGEGQSSNSMGWKIVQLPYVPTAENLARWIFEQIDERITQHYRHNLELRYVEVYETPTSVAIYGRPDAEVGHVAPV
jgi:6-pyruvoyltetrahydropterin/6-carboxytetrahydropterin synthase